MRSRRTSQRSDAQVLAHAGDMALLRAIGNGRVIRGGGGDTSMFASYELGGTNVRSNVGRLAREDLVRMPISGPPTLAPRGKRLVSLHP